MTRSWFLRRGDPWQRLQHHRAGLDRPEIYVLLRIVPEDCGHGRGDKYRLSKALLASSDLRGDWC